MRYECKNTAFCYKVYLAKILILIKSFIFTQTKYNELWLKKASLIKNPSSFLKTI